MRNIIKYLILSVLLIGGLLPASAHIGPNTSGTQVQNGSTSASLREDCSKGDALIDQAINNVRATLLLSGDVWWNGSDARYVVPKVDPASGLPEVSSIFAGAVWLGGYDDAGNLKVACQKYGSAGGNVDFWPGPLTDVGTTSQDTCENWDRHFVVYAEEIDVHLSNYNAAVEAGTDYDPDNIPDNVKYYPAKGNRFFVEEYGFELPDAAQGLGAFWDQDGSTTYEPEEGDYPIIEIRGCDEPQYADEMIYWIYNDAGNIHGETGGAEIRMEVQVQAFAYQTNDELNNMTFQRYKLINRAVSVIDSCFFAIWVDPDLGCYTDDYIGCDTTRSLMYIYNADVLDGETGCSCPGGVDTYCDQIPMLGVDYFRGPLGPKVFGANGELVNPPVGVPADTIVELGMSSFTYFNGTGGEPGTNDPNIAQEYYNYLSGTWQDGLPFTAGDDGHTDGSTDVINFAFPDPPNDINGWSMAQSSLPDGDRRTVQASGPFRLEPGAVNELIVGVPWVPNVTHPAPSLSKLFFADELAQALFDNCFKLTNGPDAPDVDWLELDRSVVALLTNNPDRALNNNVCEEYKELDLRFPTESGSPDSLYFFEGYRIYQLATAASGSETNLNDPDHFRLVAQVDIKNDITELYNWRTIDNPSLQVGIGGDFIYIPEVQVDDSPNNGIRHMFKIDQDQFGTTDSRLVNHKKYYYRVVSYAHNDWATFDPLTGIGQRKTYLVGRRNIGDGVNSYYTVIPRPIVDRTLNSGFGDQPAITRVAGEGAGENDTRMTDETRQAILDGSFDGRITYEPGAGPVNVTIFNPLNLKEADFRLELVAEDPDDEELEGVVNWVLTELDANGGAIATVESKSTIAALNEELLNDYGFAVSVVQSDIPGDKSDDSNGAINITKSYADASGEEWLLGQPDGFGLFDYIKTGGGEVDNALDPESALSQMGDGTWVPYTLCDWRVQAPNLLLTPAWVDGNSSIVRSGNGLNKLANIDVVFSSDPKDWSRCVVVETASSLYTDCNSGLCLGTEGGAEQFDLRGGASVGKDGQPDGNGTGMGYFPGYAINVETGERLNIFFGENSVYSCDEPLINTLCGQGAFNSGDPVGRDMIWNPSSEQFVVTQSAGGISMLNFYGGGQHMIYVTNQPYDQCEELKGFLSSGNFIDKVQALRQINWTSFSLLEEGATLLSNDVTVHLRVDNNYSMTNTTELPSYEFSTSGLGATVLTDDEVETALDLINVVPNPYYGFSDYETGTFSNQVKITNLPAKCVVTLYNLEGKFIRQYNRNEQGLSNAERDYRALAEGQFLPDIEWDLKNNAGIPVASGVYLIHVDAGALGERVIKWFGVSRRFDANGL